MSDVRYEPNAGSYNTSSCDAQLPVCPICGRERNKIGCCEVEYGGEMKSNKYYLINYKVRKDVNDDELFRGGSSMAVSARFLRRSKDKIICDDLYMPLDKNLSGIWPNQKFVPTTYKADSTEYYNNGTTDNRGNIFELTSRYMSEIKRVPNNREIG